MRLHRFYVNKPLGEEIVVERAGAEKEVFHQWTRVFRYQSGDEVILFSPLRPKYDFRYRISSITKEEISLVPVSSSPNISGKDITLCMAVVKKDTFETIVRQATELGVCRIIPVLASRSEKKNLNFERLSVIAIEAAEQSGRGTVPLITPIYSLEETFSFAGETHIVGSLHGKPLENKPEVPFSVWVGPEGGWTEEEETFLREKGSIFLTCADTVLKADTAAIALLATLA